MGKVRFAGTGPRDARANRTTTASGPTHSWVEFCNVRPGPTHPSPVWPQLTKGDFEAGP